MSYVALEAIKKSKSEYDSSKWGGYYVTVYISVPSTITKQFWEAPVIMVQWFVCLSVAMATSPGKAYETQSMSGISKEYSMIPIWQRCSVWYSPEYQKIMSVLLSVYWRVMCFSTGISQPYITPGRATSIFLTRMCEYGVRKQTHLEGS